MLLFYVNDIMDLIDKVNYTQSEEYRQITIYDVLENVDDLEDEQELKKAIKELKLRLP